MEEKKEKINVKRLTITIIIVIVTALVVGGTVWYVMDKQAKLEQESKEKEIQELQQNAEKTTQTETKDKDETSDWKVYTDQLGRFTLKYPNNWSYKEDVAQGSDSSLNSNVFSDDNVLFFDSAKSIVIGYNMGEVYGRGGACTKRMITYTPTVASSELKITKKEDTIEAVSDDEYCGVGETLTGYQTTILNFTEAGTSYFIHSEGGTANDTTSAEAIDIFEKMANTVTFK